MKIKLLIFTMLIGLTASAQFANFNQYGVQKATTGDSLRLVGSTVGQYLYLPTTKMLRSAISANTYNYVNGVSKIGNNIGLGGNGNWQYNDFALITGGTNKAYLEMQGQNAGFFGFANGSLKSGYFFNPSQGASTRVEIYDDVNKSGAFYKSKYRSGLTDRWLTDKEYVDSAVSNSSPMITASNGVTKNGNDITLGDYDQGAQIGNIAGTKGSLYLANSTAALKQNQGVMSITDSGLGDTDVTLYVNTGSGVRQLSFGSGINTPISIKDDISHTGLTGKELFPETDSLQYAQVGRVKQLIASSGGNTSLSSVLAAGNHANSPLVLADYYTDENDFQGMQLLAETGYTRMINRYGGNISNMLELHPFNGASLKSYNEAGSDGSQLSVTKNLAVFSKINNANELINVRGKSPVTGDDFATKAYVDASSGGGSQDLQSVTNINNNTSRPLVVTGGTSSVGPTVPSIYMSFDPTNSLGVIDAFGFDGSGSKPILLNPSGGGVSVNKSSLPAEALDVNGAAIISPNNTLANPRGILIKNQSSGSVGFQLQNTNVSNNERWQFFLSNDGEPTFKIGQDNVGDYLSVKSGTGNVGIGTPIPQEKLDVNGNANVSGTVKTAKVLVGYTSDQDGSALQVNGNILAEGVGLKSINGNPGIATLYGDFSLGRDILFQDKSYTVAGLDDVQAASTLTGVTGAGKNSTPNQINIVNNLNDIYKGLSLYYRTSDNVARIESNTPASGTNRPLEIATSKTSINGSYLVIDPGTTSITSTVIPTLPNSLTRLVDTGTKQVKTASGNGSSTTISIAHGMTGITAASWVSAIANNAASAGIQYVTVDATNVNIIYTVAPVSGTNNLLYSIEIKQ